MKYVKRTAENKIKILKQCGDMYLKMHKCRVCACVCCLWGEVEVNSCPRLGEDAVFWRTHADDRFLSFPGSHFVHGPQGNLI